MLSQEENDLLTRVGPGTPMGELFRRYWVPACLSSELPEPDGDPIRVRLLGENLVAFRDTEGRIGLVPENCAHRGASLYLGRNEEGGLRCLYHGWKIDVDGNLLDTPCEQPESVIRERVKDLTYRAQEHGDVVWAYMGPREKEPPFPNFSWTVVPAANRNVKKVLEECNWLQSLEGSMDPPHFAVLHDGRDIMKYPDDQADLRTKPPHLTVLDTQYGLCHVQTRPSRGDPENAKTVGIHPFVVPFTSYITGPAAHLFVPADDDNNYYYEIRAAFDHPVASDAAERYLVPGVDLDGSGRRLTWRAENRYLQDRAGMRAKRTYSGFRSRPQEDIAMIESMGPIYDRTQEHLGTSDVVTIGLRRRLLKAVQELMEGEEPPGLDPAIPYERLQSLSLEIAADLPWQEAGVDIADDAALALPT